tara:strand:- start:6733 stop:6912 length:180 start_codon:yes stop_codon:yes gene_type:complete
MVHIDFYLLVATILFRILPEIGEWWVEETSTDTICVGDIIPFLLACFEELVKVGPMRDI